MTRNRTRACLALLGALICIAILLTVPADSAPPIASVHTYGTLGPPRDWYAQADYTVPRGQRTTVATWLRLYGPDGAWLGDLAHRSTTLTFSTTQRSGQIQLAPGECVQALAWARWSGGSEVEAGEVQCP